MWATALVTVASLFTLVAFHVFAAQSAFTLERLSKERSNEQLRYERLREQVARLSSADTVIKASEKLGMVQGSTVIPLTVHITVPPPTTSDTLAAESPTNYGKTKSALGATTP